MGGHRRCGGGQGGQGYAAPGGQCAHQHHPAPAGVVRSADDVVERDEHVPAGCRAVLEHGARRKVASADLDPRKVSRDKGTGDPDVFGLSQESFGIPQLESKTQNRADRGQGDVALGPVQADAEHLFTVPLPLADDPVVGHCRGVGAGIFACQAEGGQLLAAGEPRQPFLLLVVGAELEDQFTGAEGIGNHDGDRRDDRMAGDVTEWA